MTWHFVAKKLIDDEEGREERERKQAEHKAEVKRAIDKEEEEYKQRMIAQNERNGGRKPGN